MDSSSFLVWKGEVDKRKGRFIVNFSRQSKHWPRGSVKMETVQSFSVKVEQGYLLMSSSSKEEDIAISFYIRACRTCFYFYKETDSTIALHYLLAGGGQDYCLRSRCARSCNGYATRRSSNSWRIWTTSCYPPHRWVRFRERRIERKHEGR